MNAQIEKKDVVFKKVSIDNVIPYYRNPRNNSKAIPAVMESIKKFGYNSPIIVDEKMTIITGDTRYRALKRLGYTEIMVGVVSLDEKTAKAYRIIDNKTSEKAKWDKNKLLAEVESIDLTDFIVEFPELKIIDIDESDGVSQSDVDEAEENERNKMSTIKETRTESQFETICPYCHKEFMSVKSLK